MRRSKKQVPETRHVCPRCKRRRNESRMKKAGPFWICRYKSPWYKYYGEDFPCQIEPGSLAAKLERSFLSIRDELLSLGSEVPKTAGAEIVMRAGDKTDIRIVTGSETKKVARKNVKPG